MDQLIEPYNELEPSYKRIGRLELWNNPLPRTRLGKLRRHIIRKQLEENGQPASSANAEAVPLPNTEEYRLVCKCLESLAGRSVKPDEHFELELGLDSLAKMTLLSSLGKDLNREIPVAMLAQHPTARSLAEALAAMPSNQTEAITSSEPIVLPKTACTHGIYRHVFSLLLHSFSKIVVEGRDNIPKGACLFAPNHQSFLDPFYLASAMDGDRYLNTFFYTISKFINGGQIAKFAKRHNMVAMEINGDIRQSLALLRKALEEGKSVVVFPEGTRSMDGSMGDFKTSFAQLALDAHAPIIPVAIDGAFDVLPRNKRMPSFGKTVSIRFLPPIVPQINDTSKSLTDKTKDSIVAALGKENEQ
jgi:long-chain acyl-CoA synthetase